MKTVRVLAAATILCTYGMVGCALYSFAVRGIWSWSFMARCR